MSDAIQIHDDSQIRWVTINRPNAANAIDTAVADGLAAALRTAAVDPEAAGVVLTGAGARAFCAGVDIRNGESAEQRRRNLRLCFSAVLDFPKPLIAAVNGVASGGGCMLALLADQRITVEDTYYDLPEINLGMPTLPGLAILTERVGTALAADLVFSGRQMTAPEARMWNLSLLCQRDDMAKMALLITASLAGKSADAFRVNKAWINGRLRAALDEAAARGTAAKD